MRHMIIGKGSLIIKVAEIMLSRNHVIEGIITNDVDIQIWCENKNIEWVGYSKYQDIAVYLKQKKYDYLFSVVNNVLLKDDIIQTAEHAVINFHDSPLPIYAGANATTWALLEHKKEHAVTWHRVSQKYDAGNILKQIIFPISEEETVFSLNAKCFEFAIKAFDELLDDIETGNLKEIAQDLEKRTYISRKHTRNLVHPYSWNAGFVSCGMSAEEIDTLYRALNFKTYENPLARLKIYLDGNCYIVTKMHIADDLENCKKEEEGTILHNYQDHIVVMTRDIPVAFDECQNIYGDGVLFDKEIFSVGKKVFISQELAANIMEADGEICAYEDFWKNRLSAVVYKENPFLPYGNTVGNMKSVELEKKASDDFVTVLMKYLWYIAYIQGSKEVSLSMKLGNGRLEKKGIFSEYLPLTYECLQKDWREIYLDVEMLIGSYEVKAGFSSDIFTRYKELSGVRMPGLRISKMSTIQFQQQRLDNYEEKESGIELQYVENENGTDKLYLQTNYSVDMDYSEVLKKQLQIVLSMEIADIVQDMNQIGNQLLDKNEIDIWNDTQADYNMETGYNIEFEYIADKYSDNIAIEFRSSRITYHELDDLSNRFAHYFMLQGISHGEKAGILFQKNINMVASILALLKIGAVYIPIDKKYPIDRITYMIQDSNANIIITDSEEDFAYLKEFCPMISLKDELEKIKQCSASMPYIQVSADDVAYIIYTSGSTGRPKGVMVRHAGLNNLKIAQKELFHFNAQDRILQFSSLSFDASIWEMTLALNVGATIVLCDSDVVHPGGELSDFIEQNHITALSLPPSVIDMLDDKRQYPALHTIISGSETCWMDLVERWREKVRFFNGYGPTEATVCVSFKEFRQREPIVTIGKAIANTKIYILNECNQLVPIGKTGEIYIEGAGLAKGYLNQKELTNEKFLPNPFGWGKMYASGDLGRYTMNGDIEFIGRKDNQVKIRGFRIEIDEIERIALESMMVSQVSCLLSDANDDKKLFLYYISKDNAEDAGEKIREYMEKKLPAYMIPSYFIRVELFPTLPNGKLDKAGLLAIKPENNAKNIAPRNNTEEILSIVWSNILGIKNIGVTEDFFHIGGHSLLAIQMVARLKEEYNINIPVSAIFEHSTIEALAKYIQEHGSEKFVPLIKLKAQGTKRPVFAVHPGDGNVFSYTDLVRSMGEERPFYGLQAYGVEKGTTALGSIEEMAAAYIKEIVKVQTKGPYILCGYCAGGTIAFEMAQQLVKSGESVEKLILLDARAPHTYSLIDEVQNFINFARNFEGITNRDIFSLYAKKHGVEYNADNIYQLIKERDLDTRLYEIWECSQDLGILPKEVDVTYLQRLFYVWMGLGGMNHYKVQPYRGSIILFKAKDDPINIELNLKYLGWERANPDTEVILVPGNHFTFMKSPIVETWCDKFIKEDEK